MSNVYCKITPLRLVKIPSCDLYSLPTHQGLGERTPIFCFVMHCTENPIYVFPEMKLRGLVPFSNIHVSQSVRNSFIPRLVLLFGCSKIDGSVLGIYSINRSHIHECGNWETEHYNSVLENSKAAQFHFWEYIYRKQTFILNSHRFFICSASMDDTYLA
jgi:hypothetical protein